MLGGFSVEAQPRTSQRAKEKHKLATGSLLHLFLRTSRKVYRVGSPIEVSSYIENQSENTSYYIGRDISEFFGSNWIHYIELRVKDEKGGEPLIGRGVSDGMWEPGTTIKEKLAQSYILLYPGTFYGIKARMELPLTPGKYRLTATYHEVDASSWSEAERKLLTTSVWTKQLRSNTVTITILP